MNFNNLEKEKKDRKKEYDSLIIDRKKEAQVDINRISADLREDIEDIESSKKAFVVEVDRKIKEGKNRYYGIFPSIISFFKKEMSQLDDVKWKVGIVQEPFVGMSLAQNFEEEEDRYSILFKYSLIFLKEDVKNKFVSIIGSTKAECSTFLSKTIYTDFSKSEVPDDLFATYNNAKKEMSTNGDLIIISDVNLNEVMEENEKTIDASNLKKEEKASMERVIDTICDIYGLEEQLNKFVETINSQKPKQKNKADDLSK